MPLKISETAHTALAEITAPIAEINEKNRGNSFPGLSGKI